MPWTESNIGYTGSMPQIVANGLSLEYESHGDNHKGEAVLLIMGLGAQMIRWPEPLWKGLVAAGYRVILFDNRDVGLSQKLDEAKIPSLAKLGLLAAIGKTPKPPYTLLDMAKDASGLLDSLGIDKAHVVGTSMGGMIAQILAANHKDRVRSLTLLMSTSGDRSLPKPALDIQLRLLWPFPKPHDLEARIRRTMGILRRIGSRSNPRSQAELRNLVERELTRSNYLPGYVRQVWAIFGSGDRRTLLSQIRVPTLVLHGAEDSLVPLDAAYDLQRRIPGAKLAIVRGMGHDMPTPVLGLLTERILGNLRSPQAELSNKGRDFVYTPKAGSHVRG